MDVSRRRRFRIHHGLGRGGFGDVYRATMESPGGLATEVAIKLLRFESDPNAEAVRRLKDEGKLLAALRHPSILRAYDLAMLDGRVGLVTEYVEGQDLYDFLRPTSLEHIPLKVVIEVVGIVAAALVVAWSAPSPENGEPMRLVHRDLKPSNIRLGRHGDVKILDFGIAHTASVDREAHTASQSTLGSLAYMAPERFARRPTGPEADVYSLGCLLFEGLARDRLHLDPVPTEMFRLAADQAVFDAAVAERLAVAAGAPEPVMTLLRQMVAWDPTRRPTAEQIEHTCESLAEQLPGATLKRWARDRTWPTAPPITTPLDGRHLTEGTVETGAASEMLTEAGASGFDPDREGDVGGRTYGAYTTSVTGEVAVAPAPATERLAPWRSRGALAGLGLLLLVVLIVGARALLVSAPAASPTPVAIPAPAPEPAPEPEPEPEPEPAPTLPPVPVPQRPRPAAPPPAPPPLEAPPPEPSPAPPPVAPVASAKIVVSGENAVFVRAVDESGAAFGAVVPGDQRWSIVVRLGHNEETFGPYLVAPGSTLVLRCNALRQDCNVDR